MHLDALKRIIGTHIILQNIIVEDKHLTHGDNIYYSYGHMSNDLGALPSDTKIDIHKYLSRTFHIRDKQIDRYL